MTVENLTKDISIEKLSKLMEELAYTSKEAIGVRTPGERCMYEIQRGMPLGASEKPAGEFK